MSLKITFPTENLPQHNVQTHCSKKISNKFPYTKTKFVVHYSEMKSQNNTNNEQQKARWQTDLISNFKWRCVLIVSSVMKLLVSQVCIVHSSTGNALKLTSTNV
jgi:hypothetical protein